MPHRKAPRKRELRAPVRRKTGCGIVQRIFSSATRRELLGKHLKGGRRSPPARNARAR